MSRIIPDLLGPRQRAERVASMLVNLQSDLLMLELCRIANGHASSDIGPVDGLTYDDRREQLEAKISEMATQYRDIMPQIQIAAKRREREEERAEQIADKQQAELEAAASTTTSSETVGVDEQEQEQKKEIE